MRGRPRQRVGLANVTPGILPSPRGSDIVFCCVLHLITLKSLHESLCDLGDEARSTPFDTVLILQRNPAAFVHACGKPPVLTSARQPAIRAQLSVTRPRARTMRTARGLGRASSMVVRAELIIGGAPLLSCLNHDGACSMCLA